MKRMQLILFIVHLSSLSTLWSQCPVASLPTQVTTEQFVFVNNTSEIGVQDHLFCLGDASLEVLLSCDGSEVMGTRAWFKIVDFIPFSEVFVSVSSNTLYSPTWKLYNLSNNGIPLPMSDCNLDDVSPEVLRYQNNSNADLYLAVTLQSDTEFDEDGQLSIRAFSNPYSDDMPCMESGVDGDAENVFSLEITDRSLGPLNIDSLFVGEEVIINVQIEINPSEAIGLSWTHGLIPHLGDGWDKEFFYENITPAFYNQVVGDWFSSSTLCDGILKRDISHLCTYTDEFGERILCNMLTNDCPCSESVVFGDPIPSAWYFNSIASQGCEITCGPGKDWGGMASNGFISLELHLKVNDNPFKNDLSIGFIPTYDDVTGCWVNTGDSCDFIPIFLNNDYKLLEENDPFLVLNQTKPACSAGPFQLEIFKYKLKSDSVKLIFGSNPNIAGIPPSTITTVEDVVNLVLINTTDEIQEFTVVGQGTAGENMFVFTQEIVIKVYPEIKLIGDTPTICEDGCNFISLEANWADNQLNYIWADGQQGNTPFLCLGNNNSFMVTITDSFGCDTLQTDIQVESVPTSNFEIVGNDFICTGSDDLVYNVITDSGEEPQEISWLATMIGTQNSVFSSERDFIISSSFLSQQVTSILITASIVEESGCQFTIEREITVAISPIQSYSISLCGDDIEDISFEVPLSINENLELESLSPLGSQPFNSSLLNDSTALITLEEPLVNDSLQVVLRIKYKGGCVELVVYEFELLEIEPMLNIEISDFEVDFSLVDYLGVSDVQWDFGDGNITTELIPTHIYETPDMYMITAIVTSPCSVDTLQTTINVTGNTVATENLENSEILIFPNPAKDIITVRCEECISFSSITMYSLDGKQHNFPYISKSIDNVTLDVSLLSSGAYLIEFNTSENRYIQKVMLIK